MSIYYWPVEVLITLKADDLSEITDWVVIPNELKSVLIDSKVNIRSVELYNILCEGDSRVNI